jgi:L-ascorbate metabolism protein UlaG (beta-lactamase superfamily)
LLKHPAGRYLSVVWADIMPDHGETIGNSGLNWRWHGLACVELCFGRQTLFVDPCLSRFPLWCMLGGSLRPGEKAFEFAENCAGILVTHCHWDHILDAAGMAMAAGVNIYGSANTGFLMGLYGVPVAQMQIVGAGDKFRAGVFQVEVLPGEHEKVPLFGPGSLPPGLRLPLTARDYHLDTYLCYLITAGGLRLMTDPGMTPLKLPEAGVLFTQPHRRELYYRQVLAMVKPRLVVPIHWDSLFRYSPQPPLTYWRPRQGWPPLKRVSLTAFAAMIKRLSPVTEVIIPEIGAYAEFT